MPRSRYSKFKIVFFVGLVAAVAGFLLGILGARMGRESAPMVMALICWPAGLCATLVGLIGMIRNSRFKEAGFFVLLGGVALPLGLWCTRALLRKEVSGVYIIGGLPIPLILVMPLVALVGAGLLLAGVVEFITQLAPRKGSTGRRR